MLRININYVRNEFLVFTREFGKITLELYNLSIATLYNLIEFRFDLNEVRARSNVNRMIKGTERKALMDLSTT